MCLHVCLSVIYAFVYMTEISTYMQRCIHANAHAHVCTCTYIKLCMPIVFYRRVHPYLTLRRDNKKKSKRSRPKIVFIITEI